MTDFILQETGDALLQENGDNLLLDVFPVDEIVFSEPANEPEQPTEVINYG